MARQSNDLSITEARRVALAAQGFAKARPIKPTTRHLLGTIDRLGVHQIDSVNVLARAHYLPAFSRLGPYDRSQLDILAWGPRSKRRLFEYWGHEASLLPAELYPLFQWRMAQADRGEAGWKTMRPFAVERRGEAEAILARIRSEGALAASDFENGKGEGGWWEWGQAKHALEWLFWAGHVTTAYRRRNFERVYDLTERVIPDGVREGPEPGEAEAHRMLVARAASALGVAGASDLRDYFRLKPQPFQAAISELIEEKIILPVRVEGWNQVAYLHSDAQRPRKIQARALLAPFDPVVWERARAERLFGFRYRIEIYTPAPNRVHGYYVLPFLLNEQLVARVDLKADRRGSRLIVRRTSVEPNAPAETLGQLADALAEMANWLELDGVSHEQLPTGCV
jgi:uncharacterized protein